MTIYAATLLLWPLSMSIGSVLFVLQGGELALKLHEWFTEKQENS